MTLLSTPISPTPSIEQPAKTAKRAKLIKLTDLAVGESGRIVDVDMPETGCRRRLAEIGVFEGAVVTVAAAGDNLILALGTARVGVSQHCAAQVTVLRV